MTDHLDAVFGAMPAHYGFKVTDTQYKDPWSTILPKNNTLPDGYIAVVTGGAVGIGHYIARSYVEAKASGVIITGRRAPLLEEAKTNLEQLAQDLGHQVKITTCAGDAEKLDSYIQLKEHIVKEHGGRLDSLVCNAGPGKADPPSWNKKVHLHDTTDFDSMLGVNVSGPYYAAHQLIPLMLQAPSEGRTVINIVSGAAHLTSGNMLPPPAYSLAKLAETRLSQIMAENYAEDDVQVFALHPGGVKTPGSTKGLPEEMAGILQDDINLCGNVCIWLSKQRPAWLSGRYLSVNWDWDELAKQKDEIVAQEKFKFKMAV